LLDQLKVRNNIIVKLNVGIKRVIAEDGKVTAIECEDRESGEVHRDELAGIFIQIGLVPNSQLVSEIVETRPWGEIVINEKCETSELGIYACGDVTTVPYKQIVVAIGEGAKASLAAYEYLLMHQSEAA
jgi:alkyl hydroperoxide reductase subunit F